MFNEATQSGETLLNLQQLFTNSEELSERERQILQFCEQQQEKLKRALNKTYKEGKAIGKIDET